MNTNLEIDYDTTLDLKFIEKVGSPFDCDFPILGTNRKVKSVTNKKILVIRLEGLAELYALNNSVTYLTDNKEKYDKFLEKVNHEKYGSDDFAILFNDWKNIDKLLEENDMKFDVIIGNPPFNEPKPEGMKRTAPRLDSKIFKVCQQCCQTAHIVFVMGSACSQKKSMKYTWMSEQFAFPGDVAITVNLFEYKPGDELLVIKTKYELNGKYDWLKQHILPLCDSICSVINVNGLESEINQDKVQPNYFFYNERSYTGIRTYLPGDSVLKKNGKRKVCLDYIKCKDAEQVRQLDNYFKTFIAEKYRDYLVFGDGNLNRGFLRTIPLPDFMK